ncbi:hypothetical protein EV696_103141 [Permianibacter aggregans]|uniref:Uncharacterized protein n=1 Tax=Permianibacter aggregans TaxID=1510150 RepID=A0A4R6URS6_9GAMM|nr:hypothetical protein EV696_103141 [Permianibacter aggregans]
MLSVTKVDGNGDSDESCHAENENANIGSTRTLPLWDFGIANAKCGMCTKLKYPIKAYDAKDDEKRAESKKQE